jgi:hypothetical protein
MRHLQQNISGTPPFGNNKIEAAEILDVEAISWILTEHPFHGQISITVLKGVSYIYCEKFRYQL